MLVTKKLNVNCPHPSPLVTHQYLSEIIGILKSESERPTINRYASNCFKKAGIDLKQDDSLDNWHKIKWSFRKPRFYNGSPLIEVCLNIAYII